MTESREDIGEWLRKIAQQSYEWCSDCKNKIRDGIHIIRQGCFWSERREECPNAGN